MPKTNVVFYQEREGSSEVFNQLESLRQVDAKAFLKCRAAIVRLAEPGHELRRPEADLLRDGIHELRVRRGTVNYRLLYFFHERTVSVVAYFLTKEEIVPSADINRAIARRNAFAADPPAHTFRTGIPDA